jgi:tetratricopeptide (TPR) repeat protein
VVDRAAASLAGSFGLKPPVAPIASITSISLAARRLYEEGLRAYYSGDRPMASRLFDAALDDDSTFAMAAYYLALTQVGAFPDSEAVYWRRAVRLAPRALDRERLLIQAAAAFSLNDVRALALAETLTVRYPDDMDGKRILGEQRFSEGNFPGSIAAFLSVVEADSAGRLGRAARCRACDAISSAVWVSMTADSLDRAERLTRDLISWNPRTAPNYALLGTVLQRRWRFDEAMDAYRRQVELTPGGGLSAAAMHMALRRGDFVVFDSIVTKLLRYAENPLERLDGLSWQASLLRETSRPRESLRVARQARHLSDSLNGGKTAHAFVMLPEALALLDLGVSDPASARAASAVFDSMAGMPTYPEPRMARHRVWMWTHQATALARARDTAALPALEQRIAETARLSSYGRDRKMPFYVRGLLLEARKDWAGAAAAYSQAIWSPTDNHVAPILAHALLESGQPARAIPVLHAWLRGPLDAANQYVPRASAHQALAEAFAATGQADSAAVHRAWVHRSIAISRKP